MITQEMQDLKELMQQELDKFQKDLSLLETYETKKCLYEEVLSIINNNIEDINNISMLSILKIELQAIYNTDVTFDRIHELIIEIINLSKNNELHNNGYKKALVKFNIIKNDIKEEYANLKAEISDLLQSINSRERKSYVYKGIITSLTYNYQINRNHYIILKDSILNNYNYSARDKVVIIEDIKNYNRAFSNNKAKTKRAIISKILKTEYPNITSVFNGNSNLDNQVEAIYSSLKSVDDINDIIGYLPSFESKLYTFDDIDYIYTNLLNKIVGKLKQSQKELLQVYGDYDLQAVVIDEFIETEKLYFKVNYFYYWQQLKRRDKEDKIENKEETNETVRNIFFASPNGGEPYIIRDIYDVPEETLEAIKELLEDFRYRQVLKPGELKNFNSNNKSIRSYQELRGDQIRIVLTNIKDNNYIISGLGLKKDDNDRNFYTKMSLRNIDIDLSDEYKYNQNLLKANTEYESIMSYIEDHKRKSNRY